MNISSISNIYVKHEYTFLLTVPPPRHLMQEYNDALNRARRLAKSCDLHVTGKAPPTSLVCVEDVLIYLRWMVFHQHSIKNTAAFLLVGLGNITIIFLFQGREKGGGGRGRKREREIEKEGEQEREESEREGSA